jgi:OmpA-OmpF porin, OOP family
MLKYAVSMPAIVLFLLGMTAVSGAQTVSFGDAVAVWANACGADVERSCNTMNPGNPGFAGCIQQNGSQACQAATTAFFANMEARFAAQAKAAEVCRSDVQRLCSGFKAGGARILRCMIRPETFRKASRPCKETLTTAGWLDTVSIRSTSQDPHVANTIDTLGQSAQKVGIDTQAIRRDIEARIRTEGNDNAPPGATMLDSLKQLPNFIVQVDFFLNSDIVKPSSWVTVGQMADALHHPLLAGNRFLVTGHTDVTGTRTLNLDLSDRRAKAFAQILESTFRVPSERLLAVGLGEEQLLPNVPPDDPSNRRVELINIGPM